MDLGSVNKNGKILKRGYTTGSCASGAAKAATYMLLNKEKIEQVSIKTPSGKVLDLPVSNIEILKDNVTCSIKKYSGDDPDITNGILVYATVSKRKDNQVKLLGGKGVGVVTLPGLSVKVGEPAINPVPRQMIINSVKELLPNNFGVDITISIPEGEQIAKKTFNPKLGIKGGISILGTSGIVEPMSEDALKQSLKLELNILRQKGYKKIIMTPGNYGSNFIKNLLDIDDLPIMKISNYVGFMLEQARLLEFEKILLIGDIGKFIKVAGGIFNTHSKVADARMEILASYAALFGVKQPIIKEILSMNTTLSVIELLEKQTNRANDIYNYVAKKVSERASSYVYNEIEIGTILFSNSIGMLAQDTTSKRLIKEFIINE